MAHKIVKLLTHDDGEKVESPKWCLSINSAATDRTCCTGEAYGEGDSSCEYKAKVVDKGGITCEECLEYIKKIKDIKL